jgi:antitoxin VapB
MSLNLKNPRAHALATELAALTGESLTEAVIRSLEDRLRRERLRTGGKSTAERMIEFGRRFSEDFPPAVSSADHGDLLHGEDGLPR